MQILLWFLLPRPQTYHDSHLEMQMIIISITKQYLVLSDLLLPVQDCDKNTNFLNLQNTHFVFSFF